MEGCAVGQVLRGSVTTSEALRRAIQNSQEPESAGRALRDQPEDGCQMKETDIGNRPSDGAKGAALETVLSLEEEAIIVAFR